MFLLKDTARFQLLDKRGKEPLVRESRIRTRDELVSEFWRNILILVYIGQRHKYGRVSTASSFAFSEIYTYRSIEVEYVSHMSLRIYGEFSLFNLYLGRRRLKSWAVIELLTLYSLMTVSSECVMGVHGQRKLVYHAGSLSVSQTRLLDKIVDNPAPFSCWLVSAIAK